MVWTISVLKEHSLDSSFEAVKLKKVISF